MSDFNKWIYTPAKWYQFWMPQSGLIGGLIFGTVVDAVFVLLIIGEMK